MFNTDTINMNKDNIIPPPLTNASNVSTINTTKIFNTSDNTLIINHSP